MNIFKKIATTLLAILVFSIGFGSMFFVVKTLHTDLGNKEEREQLEIKFKQRQDSIQNEFTILKQERDSLRFKYDSLSKIKKDAHIKKINSYRTLTLDSNITILSRTLSEKNITW